MENDGIVSWVHFGDLHITSAVERNYADFLMLIDQTNRYLAGHIDFSLLPGDNAEDGTEEQYRLVRTALNTLAVPVHIIAGDHDRKGGTLDLFRHHLQAETNRSFTHGDSRFLVLNSLDGERKEQFDFSPGQMEWLDAELDLASADHLRPVLFMHTYPSELGTSASPVRALIEKHEVLLVEMGHTHYNELANDGRTIYVATRSTGQIEEGPVGFSITNLDRDVVSWRFKPLGPWPFVMITSPADRRLITDATQILQGIAPVRAKIWGAVDGDRVTLRIDEGDPVDMRNSGGSLWTCAWDTQRCSDGEHELRVRVASLNGQFDEDMVCALVRQDGWRSPVSRAPGDRENNVGAWPAKGITGAQLGPNKNGRKW